MLRCASSDSTVVLEEKIGDEFGGFSKKSQFSKAFGRNERLLVKNQPFEKLPEKNVAFPIALQKMIGKKLLMCGGGRAKTNKFCVKAQL